MLSTSREYMWIDYEKGFDAVILTLRAQLDEINSCPDFSSFKIRREDEDKDDKVDRQTFQQEVAIWLSVQNHLVGKGLPSTSK